MCALENPSTCRGSRLPIHRRCSHQGSRGQQNPSLWRDPLRSRIPTLSINLILELAQNPKVDRVDPSFTGTPSTTSAPSTRYDIVRGGISPGKRDRSFGGFTRVPHVQEGRIKLSFANIGRRSSSTTTQWGGQQQKLTSELALTTPPHPAYKQP